MRSYTCSRHISEVAASWKPVHGSRMARRFFVQAGISRVPIRLTKAPITTATAVSAAATEASAASISSKPEFENKQRFYVPDDVKDQFEAAWKARESYMETQPGFLGFSMTASDDTYTITSKWASVPEWEAFNLSKEARRHHLPWVSFCASKQHRRPHSLTYRTVTYFSGISQYLFHPSACALHPASPCDLFIKMIEPLSPPCHQHGRACHNRCCTHF